ncbi:hypothetical protein Tco_0048274 [Tanacetum coccineum]
MITATRSTRSPTPLLHAPQPHHLHHHHHLPTPSTSSPQPRPTMGAFGSLLVPTVGAFGNGLVVINTPSLQPSGAFGFVKQAPRGAVGLAESTKEGALGLSECNKGAFGFHVRTNGVRLAFVSAPRVRLILWTAAPKGAFVCYDLRAEGAVWLMVAARVWLVLDLTPKQGCLG